MTKLEYINSLLGKCPEGYEIEKYLAGGCVKCKKGKLLKNTIQSKKRIRLEESGGSLSGAIIRASNAKRKLVEGIKMPKSLRHDDLEKKKRNAAFLKLITDALTGQKYSAE